MNNTIKIGKIKGIQIELHLSWFIIFGLVTISLATNYLPSKYSNWSVQSRWLIGILTSLMLFTSVLIHELAHGIVSIQSGIKVKRIALVLFGGIAEMENEPDEPKKEFKIALAGPLSNFILAGIFYLLSYIVTTRGISDTIYIPLRYIANINFILAVFNMMPALPLDGGRVFRAIIWQSTKDLKKATKIISVIGSAMGNITVFIGVFLVFTGNFFTGLWIGLIGWYLLQSSNSSYRGEILSNTLNKIKIGEFMSDEVITISENSSINHLIEHYFYKYKYSSFPVTRNDRLVGIVTLDIVKLVDKEERDTKLVGEIMYPRNENLTVDIIDTVDIAMKKITQNKAGRVIVVDEEENIVGIVSSTDILNYIKVYNELH